MREIVDIVLFNNEIELLDLRVKILEDVVDRFIIKESIETFQGQPKECLASTYEHPKVQSFLIGSFPGSTWERERFQRSIKVDLEAWVVSKDAIILTSDLDEVPNPEALKWMKENFNPDAMYAFDQKMFQYYLNVRNLDEEWSGTRACSVEKYNHIDAEYLRQSKHLCLLLPDSGWHWSFLGGFEAIKQKIESYSHEEYNNEETLSQITTRLFNNEDVFDRGFRLETVELDSSFPKYILENQEKLAHLIKR